MSSNLLRLLNDNYESLVNLRLIDDSALPPAEVHQLLYWIAISQNNDVNTLIERFYSDFFQDHGFYSSILHSNNYAIGVSNVLRRIASKLTLRKEESNVIKTLQENQGAFFNELANLAESGPREVADFLTCGLLFLTDEFSRFLTHARMLFCPVRPLIQVESQFISNEDHTGKAELTVMVSGVPTSLKRHLTFEQLEAWELISDEMDNFRLPLFAGYRQPNFGGFSVNGEIIFHYELQVDDGNLYDRCGC